VRELSVTIIDGRLTSDYVSPHPYATRCVMWIVDWTVSQSLSEEAADLTAATVISVVSIAVARRQPASVPSAGTERVICTNCQLRQRVVFSTLLPLSTNYYTVGLSRCVSCRGLIWMTITRYWRPSWTAIAISASITIGLPSLRHHEQERRLVTECTVRSCRSTGKKVFPTDWCALTNVDISCISLTEILSSCCREPDIHARLNCLSCMQTSFQPMPAMLTNRMTAEYFSSVRELWRY